MATVDEIQQLKTKFEETLYAKTREQQRIDDTFLNDTFNPSVKTPHKVIRLGLGYEIVNSPAEHIVTSNPQVYVELDKGSSETAVRISKVLNGWVNILKRQNPNPFKECIKNSLARGESYIKILHNPDYKDYGLPCYFLIPDPMVIYGSPDEDDNGIPSTVIVLYPRQPSDVILRYPGWSNPKKNEDKKDTDWFEYWSPKQRYFEADGEGVLKQGGMLNIYNFTPFIRKYSGFGRRSPDGELSSLIVSDLRHSRGWVEEITTMYSDISSVMHLSAHKPKLATSSQEINEEQLQQLSFNEYVVNVMDNLPVDFKIEDWGIDQPSGEAFQHASNMMAGLLRRHPYIASGFPWGSSGRQQDMTSSSAMRRYDTVVENTENQWATAFEKALKICKIMGYTPAGLRKGDLDAEYKCFVSLKEKDPLESDRLATLGSRLISSGEIDPMTNLIQFKGYTQDEAKQILIDTMKWKVIMNSPDIIELIGLRAAEKSGMAEDLQMIRERRKQVEQRSPEQTPATTQERIRGEVETPRGEEESVTRGARQPPERYERGG